MGDVEEEEQDGITNVCLICTPLSLIRYLGSPDDFPGEQANKYH